MFCQKKIAQKRNKKKQNRGNKIISRNMFSMKNKMQVIPLSRNPRDKYIHVCVFLFFFHCCSFLFTFCSLFSFLSCLFSSFHFFSLLFMSFHFCSFLFIFCMFLLLKKPLPIQTTCTSTHYLVLLTWFSPRQSTSPGHRRIGHQAAVLPWKGCFFTTPLCSRLTWSLAMSSAPHWREQSNDPLNHNSCRSRLNVDCREMSVGPRLWMHAFRISQQSQRISKRLSKATL